MLDQVAKACVRYGGRVMQRIAIRGRTLFQVCLCLCLAGLAFADEAVVDVTQVTREAVSLTPYFAVLEDPGASLTIADVTQPAFEGRFQNSKALSQALGFSFTRSAIWLRLQVKNPGDKPVERVLEITYALLASVDLYQPQGDGFLRVEAGYLRPLSEKALPDRHIALPFSVPARTDQHLYLRVETPNSMNVPARLWSPQAFRAHVSEDLALQALYFGIVLAIVLYNLTLYVGLRDPDYLLYVFFSLSVALGLATYTGMGSILVWGHAPVWGKVGSNLLAAISTLLLLEITRRVLSIRQSLPSVDQLLKLLMAANAVFVVLLIFWFQAVAPYFVALSLLASVLLCATGIAAVAQGQFRAYYFVGAFSVLLFFSMLTRLSVLGFVPASFFTSNGIQLGSVTAMLLLSMALADRFSALRREKSELKTQTLREQGELVERLQQSEKLLEERVAERTAQIEGHLAKLRLREHALNQISQGVMIANASGLLTDTNDASSKITGYSREELLGKTCAILRGVDTDPITMQQIREAMSKSQPFHGEILNYRKDGTKFWNELSILPVFNADGVISQFVGVQRNISDRKAAQAELVLARDAAEAANRAKSRFLATMSHEIRTPMNGILGMAQVLTLPNIGDAERLEYARTIVGSGQTLLALLNDILDLSRVEAGSLTLESIALQPLALLTQTTALFGQQVRQAGLTITCQWTNAPDACYLGDPHRLSQMLSNLVGNAVKFTLQGQIHIEAREISHNDQGALLEFAVQDTGVGIAPHKQALLFQSFSQTDNSITRHYGGSGLGLSIVRNLAELMGGGVGVHSEPGKGSRFWFRVRLRRMPSTIPGVYPDVAQDLTVPHRAQGLAPAQFVGRVLVVEDNLINQRIIQTLLGKQGVQVKLVGDGQQALEILTSHRTEEPFDLVLMDLQMPVMDGCTAAKQLREWEAQTGNARMPVVALTAGAFEDDRQQCIRAGMDGFMTKPVAMPALQDTLARWLTAGKVALAVANAVPAMARAPVDVEAVRTLLAEIKPLLVHNKFDALPKFRHLQAALTDTDLADDMAQSARLLQEFRFDQVQKRLSHMEQEQGWDAT